MRSFMKTFALVCLLAVVPVFSKGAVIGYWQAWRTANPTAEQLRAMTHIVVFSLEVQNNGDLTWNCVRNPSSFPATFRAINPNIQVIIALGGAVGPCANPSLGFPQATNATNRTRFVNNIVNFMNTHGFDGVDFDWEFPTNRNTTEWENYIATMEAVKRAAPNKRVSVAVSGHLPTTTHTGYAGAYPVATPSIASRLMSSTGIDAIHIMSYDMHGTCEFCWGDHANVERTRTLMNAWADLNTANKGRLILGLPFYSQSPYAEWHQNQNLQNGITLARARQQTEFAYTNNFGGVMFWELGYDLPYTNNNSLLRAIWTENTRLGGPGGGTTTQRTITASVSGGNGTISPSGTVSVANGGSQTFTFTPNANFVIDRVLVNNTAVAVSGNSHTISNITSNQTISVSFRAVNRTPTDITLSLNTLTAPVAVGATVGTLAAVDSDAGTYTFALVSGTGSTNNNRFSISGTSLRVGSTALTAGTYNIRVRVTDSQSTEAQNWFEKTFQIVVNAAVAQQHNISASVSGTGGTISPSGQVSVANGASQTFTFTPNANFALDRVLVNNTAVTVSGNSHTISNVTSSQTIVASFRTNRTPTDISLALNVLNAPFAANTTVGTLSNTDAETQNANTYTYTLVSGDGSTHNNRFTISGTTLRSGTTALTAGTYSVRIRVTDSQSTHNPNHFEKVFTIVVNPPLQNMTPTDILLNLNTLNAPVAGSTTIGTLSNVDADAGTYTYTLASGTGDRDNGRFTISGTNLRVGTTALTAGTYSVRIRVRDSQSTQNPDFFEKAFEIVVNPPAPNMTPTDILLSRNNTQSNLRLPVASGTTVGTLSNVDAETQNANTYTYTLVSGEGSADNSLFSISGVNLRTAAIIPADRTAYSVRVRVTDSQSTQAPNHFEKPITINFREGNRTPTDILLSRNTLTAPVAGRTTVGTLSAVDPDAGTYTFTLVSGTGSTDNTRFEISGGTNLRTRNNTTLQAGTYSVRIRVADSQSTQSPNWFEKAFTITVREQGACTDVATYITLNISGAQEGTVEHNGQIGTDGRLFLSDSCDDLEIVIRAQWEQGIYAYLNDEILEEEEFKLTIFGTGEEIILNIEFMTVDCAPCIFIDEPTVIEITGRENGRVEYMYYTEKCPLPTISEERGEIEQGRYEINYTGSCDWAELTITPNSGYIALINGELWTGERFIPRRDGSVSNIVEISFILDDGTTSITQKKVPEQRKYGIKFAKNPVSDKAEISVVLPGGMRATEAVAPTVVIYDMVGNVVFECRGDCPQSPANNAIVWDLRNTAGRKVASGTYLVVVEAKTTNGNTERYTANLGVRR